MELLYLASWKSLCVVVVVWDWLGDCGQNQAGLPLCLHNMHLVTLDDRLQLFLGAAVGGPLAGVWRKCLFFLI